MVLGILGKKRSGKDTAGDYLVKKYNFIKYSFAAPIKEGTKAFFGFTDEQVYGDLKDVVDEHWGVTPRKILQIIGTDVFQYFIPQKIKELEKTGRYFWVHRFLPFYRENKDKNIVICDVRFQHEVDAIHKLDGKIIKISRKLSNKIKDNHSSEKEIDLIKNYDYIIENDRSILVLNNLISNKMETILSAQS